jgi:two-component system sensor histidine kinase BaeS
MLRSLRNRLILSHALPLLVILPLMGIALIYSLETRILLPELSKQLLGDARFIAEVAGFQPQVWNNPVSAAEFLTEVNPNPAADAMLFNANGVLVGTTETEDLALVGTQLNISGMAEALDGNTTSRINYSQSLRSEVINVFVPVVTPDNQQVGVVRMTYRFSSVYQEFLQFRYTIGGILVIAILTGILLGLILAVTIDRPIQQATRAVLGLAQGDSGTALEEQGPEEIRTLLRAVNTLTRRLHELEVSRKQLLSNLVHELGRPLGALRSAILALRKGAGKDLQTTQEYLDGMDSETARLQRLLEDLAHVQEQVLGTLELSRQPIDLRQWLPNVLAPWQAAAEEKGLHWETHIPADLPVITADSVRLAQAIGNLTSNAIKFTPSGGLVETTAGVKGNQALIQVRDSGPGIPTEDLENIFKPFFRGKQGGRIPQGMGLGLGIARDLVSAHGGQLQVESEPGQGSQFTISLPI